MNNTTFSKTLMKTEAAAWKSFKDVCHNFLGNNKSKNFKQIVACMLKNYQKMNVNMSLKIHFLDSHFEFIPDNLVAMSDEHGERFHQEMSRIERNYQGHWDENMLGDYC